MERGKDFDEQFVELTKKAQEKQGKINFYQKIESIDEAELLRTYGQVDEQEAAILAKEREEELKLAETEQFEVDYKLSHAEQLELLRNCVSTIVRRVGGADDRTSTVSLLKFLADVFVSNSELDMEITPEDYTKIVRGETENLQTVFPRKKTKYVVKLKKGQGLAAKDVGGTSDPFAYIGVVPSNVANVLAYEPLNFKKSTTQKQTLEPVWNETFEFVVDSPDSKQLWLDFWDEDEGLFSSKGDGDFLGRIQVHLATLPCPNKSGWFDLTRRTTKSKVSGKIEMSIFTYMDQAQDQTNEGIEKCSQVYKAMDSIFVQAEKGQLSAASEALLSQYISQHNVPFISIATSRFINLVKANLSARLPPSKVADAAEQMVRVEKELSTLPPTEAHDLLVAMRTVHKQFERMLWRFPEFFPFGDEDATTKLYDYCDIVNLIVGIPMYKATLDAHYSEPLDIFVQKALKKHAAREYQRAATRARNECKNELDRVIILVSILLGTLQAAKKGENQALKQLGISYTKICSAHFESALRDEVKSVIDACDTEEDGVFTLYFLLQSLAPLLGRPPAKKSGEEGEDAPAEEEEHLSNFHPWFTRFVAAWFRVSGEKTREWILNAIKVDTEGQIEDGMFSSSVVDVFAGFAQTYSFLERLKWPDKMEYSAFVTMFAEMMCEGLTAYAQRMREEFEKRAKASADGQLVGKQQCQQLNNLEITHEKMRQIYELIDVPKIVDCLRQEYNSDFEPPISVLFSEQSTFIKEQLDYCLDILADEMSPRITSFIENMVTKPLRNGDAIAEDEEAGKMGTLGSSSLVRAAQSMKSFKSLGGMGSRSTFNAQLVSNSPEDSTPVTQQYADEQIQPLIKYLDDNLETLHENLYSEVFSSVLSRVWARVVDSVDEFIKPKTKQLALPVTVRQASILKESLEILHDYFYAEGDGVKTAKLDSKEYEDLRLRLGEVFQPTDELIARFYHLEEQAHGGGDESKQTDTHEDYGNMEAEIVYDSARDTLVVFLQEANGLPAMDENGLSDPYVIIRVLPEHKAIKPRTSNRLNETLNPVFNQ